MQHGETFSGSVLEGKLTEDDYTNNLIPELDRALDSTKKSTCLFRLSIVVAGCKGGAS
jgi:hypothetical protein